MVWTHPMTFTDGAVLTASQLNTHLRDNIMETEAALAQVAGDYFVSAGYNQIARRRAVSDRITGVEESQSSTYSDLATPGPSVTVTTGTHALVFISCRMNTTAVPGEARASWTISGATERETPFESTCVLAKGQGVGGSGGLNIKRANYDLITALTPGVNTFTMKYRLGDTGSIGRFAHRFLCVVPL